MFMPENAQPATAGSRVTITEGSTTANRKRAPINASPSRMVPDGKGRTRTGMPVHGHTAEAPDRDHRCALRSGGRGADAEGAGCRVSAPALTDVGSVVECSHYNLARLASAWPGRPPDTRPVGALQRVGGGIDPEVAEPVRPLQPGHGAAS